MNIWTALRRILAKHFLYHMVIPLAFGVMADVFLASPIAALAEWLHIQYVIPVARYVVPVLAVMGTYLIVMLLIITRETATPFEIANFTTVEQLIKNATSYFAVCAIPMREWFEPGAFKYFALLLSEKHSRGVAFRYDRVIIFSNSGQRRDAEATILDRYHAEALAMAHRKLDIPMGWLGPKNIRKIVRDLQPEQRIVLQGIPASFRWLPGSLSQFLWPVEFDFALIDRPQGKAVIIVPFKKSVAVVLEGNDVAPYESLSEAIKAKVYEEDGKTIRFDRDFPRLLGIA